MFCLALCGSVARAQDDYEAWKKKEQERIRKGLEEQDRAFSDFLKKDWQEFSVFQGEVPDKTPKPEVAPKVEPKRDGDKPFEEEPAPEKRIEPLPEPAPEPAPPPKPTPEPMPEPVKPGPPPTPDENPAPDPGPPPVKDTENPSPPRFSVMTVSYLGVNVPFSYDPNDRVSLNEPLNNNSIATFWESLAQSRFDRVVAEAQKTRADRDLSDWGYLELVKDAADKLFSSDKNMRNLFVWYVLVKSGYDARVGYSDNRVYLLIPSTREIYFVSYLKLKDQNRRYYIYTLEGLPAPVRGSISTYDGHVSGADRELEFEVHSIPKLQNQTGTRMLTFDYARKTYTIRAQYSKDAAEYFADYPWVDMPVYFLSAVSTQARTSLLTALRPIIKGKSEAEAVNMILRFVQTAFDYKTDPDQFGREKPLFPDETLYYPFSDCEDRCIMFSFLVRNLTGLETVALRYPGHLSLAVKFSKPQSGDTLIINGAKFLICDPTYINADIGMCMPQFKTVKPEVINID